MNSMMLEPRTVYAGASIEDMEYNKAIAEVSNSAHKYSELSEKLQKDPKIMRIALEGYKKIVKAADDMLWVMGPNDKNLAWVTSERAAASYKILELAGALGITADKEDEKSSSIQM